LTHVAKPFLKAFTVYKYFVIMLLCRLNELLFFSGVEGAVTKISSDLLQFPEWPEHSAFMKTRFIIVFPNVSFECFGKKPMPFQKGIHCGLSEGFLLNAIHCSPS
jgi:hypothetical protein